MTASKESRQTVTIPWRQTPPASHDESAGTVDRTFTSIALPIDYLNALESSRPAIYTKFRHFKQCWTSGKVTRKDFHKLVKLMHRVGSNAEAELFLRANLLVSADGERWFLDDSGLDLYSELFGTAKRDEFATAIAAFETQFSAPLKKGAGGGFMVGYETTPRSADLEKYMMRDEPCYVRFEYASSDCIEATIESLNSEDQLVFLRNVNGVWEIFGTGMATSILE